MKLRNILPWLTASLLIGSAQADLVDGGPLPGGSGVVTYSGSIAGVDLSQWTTASGYTKIVIDGATGYFAQSVTASLPLEITANGLTITNGWSNTTQTFAGGVTGSGNFDTSGASPSTTYLFTGDCSTYTGDFIGNGAGNGKFSFGDGVAATVTTNVAGTGAIINNSTLTFNYSNDVTVGNAISGTGLVVKDGGGSLEFTGSLTNTGGLNVVAGSIANTYNVYYVDASVVGGAGDGSTWSDAFSDVSSALTAANGLFDEVWVKAGSYSSATATNAYTVPLYCKLYGGFAGTETLLSQRTGVLSTNKTTLTQTAGNSRVVFMNGGSVVDGFEITGGNLTSSPSDGDNGGGGLASAGAGVYMQGGTTLSNCIVFDNDSSAFTGSGGGVGLKTSASGIVVKNSFILNNAAAYGGGLGSGASPNASITNCVISNNSATNGYGGGYASGTSTGAQTITFTNCTVVRNSGTRSESAAILSANGATINNTVFWGNSNTAVSGTFTNCALEGQTTGTNTVELSSSNLDTGTPEGPHFQGPVALVGYQSVAGDKITVLDGDWRILAASALVDVGDNSLNTMSFDIRGDARIYNSTIDIGAYEHDPNTLTPVVGLDITVNGSIMTWTAEQEIGVAEYQVQQLVDGVWTTVEVLTAGAVSYESLINPAYDVRLVVVDQSGFYQSFLPDLAGQARQIYALNAGWNLLSLPFADADLTDLLDAVDGLPMTWNGSAYEIAEALNAGDAFFVYASEAAEVTVSGTRTVEPLVLTTGWNLAGVTENQQAPLEASIIYTLDSSYDDVTADDLLIEGVGYWIYAD